MLLAALDGLNARFGWNMIALSVRGCVPRSAVEGRPHGQPTYIYRDIVINAHKRINLSDLTRAVDREIMIKIIKICDPDYVIPIIELSLNGLPVASFISDDSFELRCEINPDFSKKHISVAAMANVAVLLANVARREIDDAKARIAEDI